MIIFFNLKVIFCEEHTSKRTRVCFMLRVKSTKTSTSCAWIHKRREQIFNMSAVHMTCKWDEGEICWQKSTWLCCFENPKTLWRSPPDPWTPAEEHKSQHHTRVNGEKPKWRPPPRERQHACVKVVLLMRGYATNIMDNGTERTSLTCVQGKSSEIIQVCVFWLRLFMPS